RPKPDLHLLLTIRGSRGAPFFMRQRTRKMSVSVLTSDKRVGLTPTDLLAETVHTPSPLPCVSVYYYLPKHLPKHRCFGPKVLTVCRPLPCRNTRNRALFRPGLLPETPETTP